MKKQLPARLPVLLVVVALLLSACGSATDVPYQPTPAGLANNLPSQITLAAIQDLSGPNSTYGLSIQQGIDLAVKQINAQKFMGQGVLLKVAYTDTASSTDKVMAAFLKATGDPQLAAIIGPTTSTEAISADPLAQQAGIPVVASSNTAAGITAIGNFIFRTSLPDSAVIPMTAGITTGALALKRVAIIYGKDDTTTLETEALFKEAFTKDGVQILPEETFVKGQTDFSLQLDRIDALEPDALVIAALPEEAFRIMIQARQMNIPTSAHYLGGNSLSTPKIAQLAGAVAEGTISSAGWDAGSNIPASQNFVRAFLAEYGSLPDQFAAQAYTAAWVVALAIQRGGSTDHASIRNALVQTRFLGSPLGPFFFDGNRDPVTAPIVMIVKGGRLVPYKP